MNFVRIVAGEHRNIGLFSQILGHLGLAVVPPLMLIFTEVNSALLFKSAESGCFQCSTVSEERVQHGPRLDCRPA